MGFFLFNAGFVVHVVIYWRFPFVLHTPVTMRTQVLVREDQQMTAKCQVNKKCKSMHGITAQICAVIGLPALSVRSLRLTLSKS